jgi:hypothetical protein
MLKVALYRIEARFPPGALKRAALRIAAHFQVMLDEEAA